MNYEVCFLHIEDIASAQDDDRASAFLPIRIWSMFSMKAEVCATADPNTTTKSTKH